MLTFIFFRFQNIYLGGGKAHFWDFRRSSKDLCSVYREPLSPGAQRVEVQGNPQPLWDRTLEIFPWPWERAGDLLIQHGLPNLWMHKKILFCAVPLYLLGALGMVPVSLGLSGPRP